MIAARLVGVSAILLSSACAGPAMREIQRSVVSGQEARVNYHSDVFGRECAPMPAPPVILMENPKNGKVRVSESINPEWCGNMPGTAVFYTSDPGFVGEDRFTYTRVGARGGDSWNVAVAIKVSAP